MAQVCLTKKQKEQAAVNAIWKKAVDSIAETFEAHKDMTKQETAEAIGVGLNTWPRWKSGKTVGNFKDVATALYRAGYEIKIEKQRKDA